MVKRADTDFLYFDEKISKLEDKITMLENKGFLEAAELGLIEFLRRSENDK